MLDVAIIGGGPAGAAAAMSLKRLIPNVAFAVFDMPRGGFWKPGEMLSPAAMPLLESLGFGAALRAALASGEALKSFGSRAVWGSEEPYERDFLYSLHGNGWRLDRVRFDALLLDTAELTGIEVNRGVALQESAAGEDCWHLKFRHAAQVIERDARFVIDASGRSARFAMKRGAKPICNDRLAGVFVLFEIGKEGIGLDTMIESAEEGWWYSTTVPGGIGVAAWMSDADLIREKNLKDVDRWSALLEQSTYTKLRMKGTMMKRAPMIFSANSQRLDVVCGRGWVSAGDAAMTFDPLSSQGITKALRSGKMASFVAADFLRGSDTHVRYATLAAAEYAEYQRVRTLYYSEEKRWPHSPFWARRVSL